MRRARVSVALLALAVYIALPTRDFYWDGITFAHTIESASRWADLIHPNHLFYNFMGYILYRLTLERFRALYLMQAMDAVFGAATAYVLFGVLSDLGHSVRTCVLLTGLFAFSGTWWRFATDADAYVPSVFFLVVSARLLLPQKKSRPVSVAALHAVAMMLHELAVLFFPAAVLALWCQRSEATQRSLVVTKYSAGEPLPILAVVPPTFKPVVARLDARVA